MPPKPLFKTSRIQTVAVAVLMALFLLAATGLAKLQTGRGQSATSKPVDRAHEIYQSESVDAQHTIVIETPSHWRTEQSVPGRFVASDPANPTRSITLLAALPSDADAPVQAARRFFEQHLQAPARDTFTIQNEPMGFASEETGLSGIQFHGTSVAQDGTTQQHLLAYVTLRGKYFWWVYLTDTVRAGDNENEVLRANIRLLQSMYRSIRVAQE